MKQKKYKESEQNRKEHYKGQIVKEIITTRMFQLRRITMQVT
jgi:hypothetical protein